MLDSLLEGELIMETCLCSSLTAVPDFYDLLALHSKVMVIYTYECNR